MDNESIAWCIIWWNRSWLGLGIVFRGGASTGGTDLAAQIITKYTGFSLGTSVLLFDGLIVFSAAFVFDIEKALLCFNCFVCDDENNRPCATRF